LLSSFSSIFTSWTGSPEPSFPSASVVPDASTMWMNMSACLSESRNLLPSPLPSEAPSTKPATSISSTGTNLVSPVQNPVLGLHFVLSSLHKASTLTYPIPWFGSIVANGYEAIKTSESVAALKNVDFPHDGFPTNPSNILFINLLPSFFYFRHCVF